MAPDTIAEQVISIIAMGKRVPRERVSLNNAFYDLGFDSLDIVVLLSDLEDHFKIQISTDEARSIRTVRDVVEGVKRLKDATLHDSTPQTS